MSDTGFFGLLEAAKKYRAGGPGPKATLMALMARMGETEDGWACWPTMASLAFDTEQDIRTVRRHVAAFESAGIIERRSRGASGGGRASNLFVLDDDALLGGKPDTVSAQQTGHRAQANRTPEHQQTGHRAQVAPYIGTPNELPGTTNARASRSTFEAWWGIYPRKAGKAAARKAWDKVAGKDVTVAKLIEAAERYRDDPNRDPSFTAHPATWLNQGRWDDEPLPPRSNGNGSVGSRTVANVAAMHQRRSLGPPPTAERFELRSGETATFRTTRTVLGP